MLNVLLPGFIPLQQFYFNQIRKNRLNFRLQNKLEELRSLQDAHLLRPTALNDSNLQEKYIQNLTLEITRVNTNNNNTI